MGGNYESVEKCHRHPVTEKGRAPGRIKSHGIANKKQRFFFDIKSSPKNRKVIRFLAIDCTCWKKKKII